MRICKAKGMQEKGFRDGRIREGLQGWTHRHAGRRESKTVADFRDGRIGMPGGGA